jgi:hypothetical protein
MSSPILRYSPAAGTPSGVGDTLPSQGNRFYWPSITRLTGGVNATDLDAQDISALPNNSLIEVAIPARGGSVWLRVKDETIVGTDVNAGVIKPISYDVSLRPYALKRYLGF